MLLSSWLCPFPSRREIDESRRYNRAPGQSRPGHGRTLAGGPAYKRYGQHALRGHIRIIYRRRSRDVPF